MTETGPTDDIGRMLAHELLNSLTVIGGYATTLRVSAQQGSTELVTQCAEVIERHAAQMEALIRASQDVRLIELGQLHLEKRPVDLGEAVREAVEHQTTALQGHAVDLVVDGPVVVSADPVRLRGAVTNLLTNAAKFSPPGSPISVRVTPTPTDGRATVVVTDEGPGVAPDKREEIFGKFGRLSHKVPGTGLGLYITRSVARLHGGDVTVGDGERGAVFVLSLPARLP